MKIIEFPEEEFRELNRMIYNVFKYFSRVTSNLGTEDKRVQTPTEVLRTELYPWQCYKFDYLDKHLLIHRHRSGHFSLECQGFVLTKLKPYHDKRRVQHDYRFQNYYGDYVNLSDCVDSFNRVVKNICSGELGELF